MALPLDHRPAPGLAPHQSDEDLRTHPIPHWADAVPVTRPKPAPWWAPNPQLAPAVVARARRSRVIRVVVTLTFVSFVLLVASSNPGASTRTLSGGAVEEPASLTALSAMCGVTVRWPDPPADEIGWVIETQPDSLVWRTMPPVSGNFAPQGRAARFIDIAVDQPITLAEATANLYRGWTVVWYDPTVDQATRESLRHWAESVPGGEKLLVAPRPFSLLSEWPLGRSVIYTSWGRSQGCAKFAVLHGDEFLASTRKYGAPGVQVPLSESGPKASVRTTLESQ